MKLPLALCSIESGSTMNALPFQQVLHLMKDLVEACDFIGH